MIMEFFYFRIHWFHALFSSLDLFFGLLDIFFVFLRMHFATTEVQLTFGGKESSENIWTMTDTSAAVLNGWNVADIWVRVWRSILFERQNIIKLLFIWNFLKLLLVTLDLLFQVFYSLGYAFSDF